MKTNVCICRNIASNLWLLFLQRAPHGLWARHGPLLFCALMQLAAGVDAIVVKSVSVDGDVANCFLK